MGTRTSARDEQLQTLMNNLLRNDLDAAREVYSRYLDTAIKIFEKEPIIQSVNAQKAIVVGDLHGDTATFNRVLTAYPLEKYAYVILGDMVDRGTHCTELLAALLACKIQHPKTFIMLRGDHESPIDAVSPQQFPDEFLSKLRDRVALGEIYGMLFQALPVAAVLNQRYFLVHGGIPIDARSVKELSAHDKVVDPYVDMEVYQMLWNDPSNDKGYSVSDRGAYLFGPDITKRFLEASKLDLVLRGHEHRLGGFRYEGDVLTLLTTVIPTYPGDKPYIARVLSDRIEVFDVSRQIPTMVQGIPNRQ